MKSIIACLLVLVAAAASAHVFPYGGAYYGGYYGGYPGGYYGHGLGYGYYGAHGGAHVDPYNHEFDYRQFGNYPVHVGDGRFIFLGLYHGTCAHGHSYGFYHADNVNDDSFVVCDHGRAHHFQCPKGTKNKGHSHFVENSYYGMGELCGVNLNDNNQA